MGSNTTGRAASRLAIVLLGGTLSACSIVDPYVFADKEAAAYVDEPTFQTAVEFAHATREEYFGAISDQAKLRSGTGLALIPAAAIAAFLGITSSGEDVIAALGVGGDGLFAASTFLGSKPRQLIFAAGAEAVGCTLETMEPLRVASQGEDLGLVLTRLPSQIRTARGVIEELNRLGFNVERAVSRVRGAEEVIAAARAAREQGLEASALLGSAPGKLFEAIQQIRVTVATAVIATEPNLTALASQLGSAIPLTAGQLTGAAVFQPQAVEEGDEASLTVAGQAAQDALLRELENAVQALEESIATIDLVVENIGQAPSDELLEKCSATIDGAGRTLTVVPDSDLEINAQSSSVQFAVTEGKPPYVAALIGRTSDKIEIGAPTYDGVGGATFTVTATGASPAIYVIRVADAGNQQSLVRLKIDGTSP